MAFSAHLLPSVSLLKQTSLCEDLVTTKNGLEKNAHVVVKNSPFCVTFGFVMPSTNSNLLKIPLDFHKYSLDIKLLYDSEVEKEVDFLAEKPFLFKPTINQSGSKLTLEVRIKVLTSQLEHMLFRVGLKLFDPQTKQLMFESSSEAIKVISKSDQVKKKKMPRKKASSIHELGDYLVQIEARQAEYNELLEQIANTNQTIFLEATKRQKIGSKGIAIRAHSSAAYETIFVVCGSFSFAPLFISLSFVIRGVCITEGPSFQKVAPKKALPNEFGPALMNFLDAFSKLSESEKISRMRSMLVILSDQQQGEFAEMLDLLWTEGLCRELPEPALLMNFSNPTTTTTTSTTTQPPSSSSSSAATQQPFSLVSAPSPFATSTPWLSASFVPAMQPNVFAVCIASCTSLVPLFSLYLLHVSLF